MAEASNRHLTLVERCKIDALLSRGLSFRAIGRELGFAHTTIAREVKRNHAPDGRYEAQAADAMAVKRRHHASSTPRKVTPQHLDHIYFRLLDDQRPDVIAHRTEDPALKLSTTWIYELLAREVANGDDEWATLLYRKFRRRRFSRKGHGAAHLIPDRVDIDQRPKEVDTRETFGHWEGDTVIGAGHQGTIVTLVERKTRFFVCYAVPRRTKTAVGNAIIAMMRSMQDTVKTITFDNGGEFADHARIAKALKCKVYFAKAYHSWERGTNENLNGELRRIDPKSEPLDGLTRADMAYAMNTINHRYRKILAYDNATERFEHKHAFQLE